MSEAEELYRGALLEHGRHPKNRGPLPQATHSAEGYSPLCGDRLTVHAHVDKGHFSGLRFEGQACVVAVASASLMTEFLHHHAIQDAHITLQKLREMLAVDGPHDDLASSTLAALTPVRGHPLRRRCATLAWETLADALAKPSLCSATEAP